MKSVKNQYIALKEGKMTEAQFMRNVRMTLPQYISNVTLFKQAERILINKGIIQEGIHDRDILSSPYTNVKSLEQSPEQLSKAADDRSENMLRMKYSNQIQDPNISDDELRYLLSGKGVKGFGGRPNAINKIIANRNSNKIEALNSSDESALEKIVSKYVKDADDISKEMDAYSEKGYKGFSDLVQANLNRDDEFIKLKKQLPKETSESLNEAKLVVLSNEILDFLEERGIINSNDAQKVHKDLTAFLKELGIKEETEEIPGFEGTLNALDKISLREAFKIKDSYDGYYNQDGKEQYSQFDELDNMNAQEVMAGYVMEKIDNPNIDINEATKLIIKNLNKDPYYYTNYKLTGVRGEKPVEFTSDKRKPGFDQTEEVSKNGDNLKDTKNAEKVLKEGYKLLSNPSKVKLKELVRKMMKEMFDGRDNMTDVTGENN